MANIPRLVGAPDFGKLVAPEESLGKRLEGKRVLLTGTTKGVGRVTQELLCAQGALSLIHIWEYVHAENPARFAFYGQAVFGLTPTGDVEADALSAIDETRAFFASLGMPTTLAELDVEEADIPKMLPTLAQNKGVPFGTFKKLTLEDAAAIYRLAL